MKRSIFILLAVTLLLSCQRGRFVLSGNALLANVTGLVGQGLILQVNGSDNVTVTSNDQYLLSAYNELGAYSVSVTRQPLCKPQNCTVSSTSGTVFGLTEISVTCRGDRSLVVTSNVTAPDLKLTDDFHSYSDGTNASPRIVSGANTAMTNPNRFQNLTVDRVRKRVYFMDTNRILGFDNIDSTSGNILPVTNITLSNAASIQSIAVDSYRDRMYVTGDDGTNWVLFVLSDFSGLSGAVNEDLRITLGANTSLLTLDELNDRIYVLDKDTGLIQVFNNASSLLATSSASRTIQLTQAGGPFSSLNVDPCSNKLVVGQDNKSTANNDMAIFNSASTLSGNVDFDADSVARRDSGAFNTEVVAVDTYQDKLLAWKDNTNQVWVWDNFSTLSGNLGPPDRTIMDSIDKSYGMGFFYY